MFRCHSALRYAVSVLSAWLLIGAPAHAAPQDASALLRMCQGADKVKALSVMCHSYLNGYLDTAASYEKGRLPFCIAEGDKLRMPTEVVSWLRLHPELAREAAPAVLKKALSERFPCQPRK